MSKIDVYVKRRSWNAEEKRGIVAESFTDGVAAVARRHGLQPHQIYYWRQKMSGCVGVPGFLKVEVSSALPAPFRVLPPESVEIAMPGGLALRVPISAGPAFVADVAVSLSRGLS